MTRCEQFSNVTTLKNSHFDLKFICICKRKFFSFVKKSQKKEITYISIDDHLWAISTFFDLYVGVGGTKGTKYY